MSKQQRERQKMERTGRLVACPVCGAPGGQACRGSRSGQKLPESHEERRKRSDVFAERRAEGSVRQQKLAPYVRKARAEEKANRRRNGPVRSFNASQLTPEQRAAYTLAKSGEARTT